MVCDAAGLARGSRVAPSCTDGMSSRTKQTIHFTHKLLRRSLGSAIGESVRWQDGYDAGVTGYALSVDTAPGKRL